MANQHNYPLIGQAFIGSKILSANFTLTGTDSGKGFTNASATGSITITLPKSAPGLIYQFLVVAAQPIVVQPLAVDTIRGSTLGTAVTMTNTVGNFLYLECLTTGFWEVIQRFSTGGGGVPTGLANPTALVGLAAVNGTATTAMRSDAAPALDVTISPTWTGRHVFAPSGGGTPNLTINANSGTTGYSSFTGTINLGTSGGDYPAIGYNWVPATGGAGNANYAISDFASRVRFGLGGVQIQTAASGTAGNSITFATTLSVNQSGAVTIAAPSGGNQALTIAGATNSRTIVANLASTGSAAIALTLSDNGSTGNIFLEVQTANFSSTGATTPALTANKPGAGTAILGWLRTILNGSNGWIPVWAN